MEVLNSALVGMPELVSWLLASCPEQSLVNHPVKQKKEKKKNDKVFLLRFLSPLNILYLHISHFWFVSCVVGLVICFKYANAL